MVPKQIPLDRLVVVLRSTGGQSGAGVGAIVALVMVDGVTLEKGVWAMKKNVLGYTPVLTIRVRVQTVALLLSVNLIPWTIMLIKNKIIQIFLPFNYKILFKLKI